MEKISQKDFLRFRKTALKIFPLLTEWSLQHDTEGCNRNLPFLEAKLKISDYRDIVSKRTDSPVLRNIEIEPGIILDHDEEVFWFLFERPSLIAQFIEKHKLSVDFSEMSLQEIPKEEEASFHHLFEKVILTKEGRRHFVEMCEDVLDILINHDEKNDRYFYYRTKDGCLRQYVDQ